VRLLYITGAIIFIRLIYGECIEEMDNLIADGIKIDMILCDLPYGATACAWDKIIPFEALWDRYNRLIKTNGAIVLFANEPFASLLRTSNLEMYRYDWVWNKTKPSNFQLMNFQCGRIHELILVFSKSKACYTKNGNSISYYPQKEKRERPRKSNVKIYGKNNLLHNYNTKDNIKIYDDKHPVSIISFKKDNLRLHPTQKPLELCEYLVKTYTKENETVLDNCMGSGTTGVACKNLNRSFIGIESDEKYYQISKGRIETA